MKKYNLMAIATLICFVLVACEKNKENNAISKRSQKQRHPSGLIVVASEGNYEPHSIGSYTIFLYEEQIIKENSKLNWLKYLDGHIINRDGSVEDLLFADINGDAEKDIVVTIRCVGSGSYLSADGFLIKDKQLELYRSVSDLDKDANPVLALKQKKK